LSEQKELPKKWREHIRKMVEYSRKSNQMRIELEDYLIKVGLSSDQAANGCSVEDSIIDTTTQTYDWKGLIESIEDELNGGMINEMRMADRIARRN
jgi:hypothetical protein